MFSRASNSNYQSYSLSWFLFICSFGFRYHLYVHEMSSEKNRYWIPNLDINKKVITQEIQYYLGPESTVRPYTREVLTQNLYRR
jgi:hypothetical protein